MLMPLLAASNAMPRMVIDLLVLLAVAAVVAIVAQKARLASIPAYLIAGAIIGPHAIGLVDEPARVQSISDLAVILLMFGIGLHMDLSVLAHGLAQMLTGAVLAIALCVLALTPISLLMFDAETLPGALAVAMGLSLSSTAVVLRLLQDRRELDRSHGRLSLAILVVQDLAAIGMMLSLPLLAQWNGTLNEGFPGATLTEHAPVEHAAKGMSFGLRTLVAVAAMAALIAAGKILLPRMLREAARLRSSEVLMVVSTVFAVGAAGLTQYLVNNSALGAFIAGFLLSSTEFRHQLAGQIGTIKDLFAVVFFTAVGMSLDMADVVSNLGVVVLGAALVLIIKSAAIAFSCWVVGCTRNTAVRTGIDLSQAGEFTVVLVPAAYASSIGLVSERTLAIIISITVLSLLVTPWLMQLSSRVSASPKGDRTAPWARRSLFDPRPKVAASEASDPHTSPDGGDRHVIVAGYGLVGRAVADKLSSMGIDTTIIELNPGTVQRQSKLGRRVIFGDVSSPEILEIAGVHHADALVLTVPDEQSVLRACKVARGMSPHIFILARTGFVSRGIEAATLGADGVVVQEMATANEMERIIARIIEQRRAEAKAAQEAAGAAE